jgi:thiamine biosynthesis lipoprotein
VIAHRPLLLTTAALLLSGCNTAGPAVRKETRLMMDTYVTIITFAPAAAARRATSDAFARLEAINRKFNSLDSTSPLHAFNEKGTPITDSDVVAVIRAATDVSERSAGAFDITVEPLVQLWGFYSGDHVVPAQRAIDSCRRMVDYRNLKVEPGRVTKLKPWVKIDLGGIAKGYALKEAARVLRADGVENAVIDLGGDVYAIGRKGKEDWRVGIRNPRGDGTIGVVEVSSLAVVTSGDYERFFFGPPVGAAAESTRYCHILDPATGWPARGIVSTTVVMRDPLTAQGWSKVLFIRGPAALGLVDSVGGIEALLVDDNMEVTMTPELSPMIELTPAESAAPR